MLNIEKYKDEIEKNLEKLNNNTIGQYYNLMDAMAVVRSNVDGEMESKSLLDWLCSEYKEPILPDEERKYLKVVFKPFASRIRSVRKVKECDSTEYLEISVKSLIYNSYEYISLASYLPNTIYKNMEVDEPYTLEELGIEYGDEE